MLKPFKYASLCKNKMSSMQSVSFETPTFETFTVVHTLSRDMQMQYIIPVTPYNYFIIFIY